MERVKLVVILFLGLMNAYSLFAANFPGRKTATPNIIYILADDMGLGDVSTYNPNGKISTPNIDRLAFEGMKFNDAHTNSSVCTPTRYGILTGRYAWRTHLKKGVLGGHSSHLIDTNRETVAGLLKKKGYATACIGKWHLGMDWPSTDSSQVQNSKPLNIDFKAPIQNGPLSYGFDYYFGIAGSLNMDPHAFIENKQIQGTLKFYKTIDDVHARGFIQPAKPGWIAKEYEQEKVLATFAEKTCNWIRTNADNPFFMYFPLPSPHSPIVPSNKFKGKSGLNGHGDFCMETDWVVGEVLKILDELNIADNTIIIYTADNGTSPKAGFQKMQQMGHYSSLIYRGNKGTLWEGGHRVPFIVRWPGNVKAGTESEQIICSTDLFATLADLFDVKVKANEAEDSYSFLPALKEKEIKNVKERMIVHHSDAGIFAVRQGKWKLMFDNKGGSHRRNPKDKPVINNADLLLFDMENDPEESTNLSVKYPEIVESLKKHLAKVIQSGRSTLGIPQSTDLKTAQWPQIKIVEEYFE